MANIFIILPVRKIDLTTKVAMDRYVANLEEEGHIVYYPPRDTDQNATGLEICTQNANGIKYSDEVHVWYTAFSQGSHFDLGMSFMFHQLFPLKKIVFLNHDSFEVEINAMEKSFPKMINEWKTVLVPKY